MSEGSLLPKLTAEEVLAATERHWDTSSAVPTPKDGWLVCPICGETRLQVRWWKWHMRPKPTTLPYRCDIQFKCTGCAFCWNHGVAISQEAYERRPLPRQDKQPLPWRKIEPFL